MKKAVVVVGVVMAGLVSLCLLCAVAGAVMDGPTTDPTGAVRGAGGELDGRYDCMLAATVMMNGMMNPQYQPTGISFTIDGDAYSSSGGDGSVRFDAEVVSFIGGGMDGWYAGRGTDSLIIHKNANDPHPSGNVQIGDFRCARR